MSDARKIWAAHPNHERHFSARSFSDPDLPAHLCHHDDVVRELVEAAQRLVGHDEWGTRKYTDDGMWADGEALRAALAKIAQEG